MDAFFDYIGALPGWIQTGAGLMLFSVLIGTINKAVDKNKIMKITRPIADKFGLALSVFLDRLFGADNAEKLENGMFDTLFEVGEDFFKTANKSMKKDNKK